MSYEEEIKALNDGVLDFEALMKVWAKQVMLTTDQDRPRNSSGQNDVLFEFSWNKVKIVHDDLSFGNDALSPPSPKTTVLFRSTYTNESDQEQINNFRAQRTTTSRAELTVLEGVCLPVDGVRVPLPQDVAEANAGFPPSLSVCKKDRKSWEEKLTWSVDTQITVGARQTTQAQMVVEEKQWNGNFSIATTISGKVKFVARNKATGNLITSSVGKVEEICQMKGLNIPGMTTTKDEVIFTTSGDVKFRYGVEQRVNIKNDAEGDD